MNKLKYNPTIRVYHYYFHLFFNIFVSLPNFMFKNYNCYHSVHTALITLSLISFENIIFFK